jgi:hypothetical protein
MGAARVFFPSGVGKGGVARGRKTIQYSLILEPCWVGSLSPWHGIHAIWPPYMEGSFE